MVWYDSPDHEHRVADVSLGQGKIWQAVTRSPQPGRGPVRLPADLGRLGRWDDHVATLDLEATRTASSSPTGPVSRC